MFQFSWFSSLPYEFRQRCLNITWDRFSDSGISGSTPVSGFPKLIATCYALHRLSAPRYPPYALCCLTNLRVLFLSYICYPNQYFFFKEQSSAMRNKLSNQQLPRKYRAKLKLRILKMLLLTGGGERDRTDDLLRARQALSQLSYTPKFIADFRFRNAD